MKLHSILLALLSSFVFLASPVVAKRLVVGVDKLACPAAAYSSIQAAVNAASPGDEIHICRGIYVEQVVIQKPLDIDADNGATLMPSAVPQNSISLFDSSPLAIALLVVSTTSVSIDGLIVNGSNSGAAQNGIQIGFGDAGSIDRNTVANNLWSPCTSTTNCAAVATNILATQSDGVTVSDNAVAVSKVGIFVDGNSADLSGNQSSANSVFDGIRLQGNFNQARQNTVFNASESGIFVDGDSNGITPRASASPVDALRTLTLLNSSPPFCALCGSSRDSALKAQVARISISSSLLPFHFFPPACYRAQSRSSPNVSQ